MSKKPTAILSLCALALLASCGPGNESAVLGKAVAAAVKKKPAATGTGFINVPGVLAATKAPVSLILVEKTKTPLAILEIERNGSYQTYSSVAHQSITFRKGMIVATRATGGDLMSASLEQSLSLVSRKQSGSAKRIMRYITAEDITLALDFDCEVSVQGSTTVTAGEINTSARKVSETCTGEDYDFVNTYAVDAAGDIVQSYQWISPLFGYVTVQPLRK